MTTQQAIEQVDKEYGIFSQATVEYFDDAGDVMLAPIEDSLYENSDLEFLQAEIRARVTA